MEKKRFYVTLSYTEYYFLEAHDAEEVEYQVSHGKVEPIEEDVPLMEISEIIREGLH